jgi:hypothetical protein
LATGIIRLRRDAANGGTPASAGTRGAAAHTNRGLERHGSNKQKIGTHWHTLTPTSAYTPWQSTQAIATVRDSVSSKPREITMKPILLAACAAISFARAGERANVYPTTVWQSDVYQRIKRLSRH